MHFIQQSGKGTACFFLRNLFLDTAAGTVWKDVKIWNWEFWINVYCWKHPVNQPQTKRYRVAWAGIASSPRRKSVIWFGTWLHTSSSLTSSFLAKVGEEVQINCRCLDTQKCTWLLTVWRHLAQGSLCQHFLKGFMILETVECKLGRVLAKLLELLAVFPAFFPLFTLLSVSSQTFLSLLPSHPLGIS